MSFSGHTAMLRNLLALIYIVRGKLRKKEGSKSFALAANNKNKNKLEEESKKARKKNAIRIQNLKFLSMEERESRARSRLSGKERLKSNLGSLFGGFRDFWDRLHVVALVGGRHCALTFVRTKGKLQVGRSQDASPLLGFVSS